MTSPALTVTDLTVAYNQEPVLIDIDLQVPSGALAAIVGPNGAGKSTLLKATLGLIPTVAGKVEFFGKRYIPKQNIAYVPQRSSIDWDFPTNALDVVTMGLYGSLKLFQRPGRDHRSRALEALERVGMAAFADRQISQLSGGQQQRVFLARAIAQDAALYMMDEPLAGVDATTEEVVIEILRELQNEGRTLIAVHHDLSTLHEYFDFAVLLNKTVFACGPVAEAATAQNIGLAYDGRVSIPACQVDCLMPACQISPREAKSPAPPESRAQ